MRAGLHTLFQIVRECGYVELDVALAISNAFYYKNIKAIGQDFITAPELSEDIAIAMSYYIAQQYSLVSYNRPNVINHKNNKLNTKTRLILLELGGGNGTLLARLLNELFVLIPEIQRYEIYIVEISENLRRLQIQTIVNHCKIFICNSESFKCPQNNDLCQKLSGLNNEHLNRCEGNVSKIAQEVSFQIIKNRQVIIRWLDDVTLLNSTFFSAPSSHYDEKFGEKETFFACIANEFFDALPVSQYIVSDDGSLEKIVLIFDEQFSSLKPARLKCSSFTFDQGYQDHIDQDCAIFNKKQMIYEFSASTNTIMEMLCGILQQMDGCCCIVDYGYKDTQLRSSTIQAVYQHQRQPNFWEHLCRADISHFVNFFELQEIIKKYNNANSLLLQQTTFLEQFANSCISSADKSLRQKNKIQVDKSVNNNNLNNKLPNTMNDIFFALLITNVISPVLNQSVQNKI